MTPSNKKWRTKRSLVISRFQPAAPSFSLICSHFCHQIVPTLNPKSNSISYIAFPFALSTTNRRESVIFSHAQPSQLLQGWLFLAFFRFRRRLYRNVFAILIFDGRSVSGILFDIREILIITRCLCLFCHLGGS